MTETNISNNLEEFAQYETNEAMLRQNELGVIVAEAYKQAVNVDGRLKDIAIVPITDPNVRSFGRAVPKWAEGNTTGRHEVHLRLDDLDATLAFYQNAIDTMPDAMQIFADQLMLEPKELTPQLLMVHAQLHEMGHVTEFMNNEDNPEEFRLRNRREKLALPIGNATASALLDPSSKAGVFVDEHWDQIQLKFGVGDINELVGLQTKAYRSMVSETHADNFAADVMAFNPQMISQLTQHSVDAYRNFANAA